MPESEIHAWLRDGGRVVTASDRAARAIRTAFHRARRGEGLSAWHAPNVLDWKSFARVEWEQRSLDDRLLLNPTQEQALWTEIAANSAHLATVLEGPRHRLAGMAMEAHEFLCSFAPGFLKNSARVAWQQDTAVFGHWLESFDETCRNGNLLSSSRLPLELIPLLESDLDARPPLLLAGFDRLLPAQRSLFGAWGRWQEAATADAASNIAFHEAFDPQTELASCAIWCSRKLAEDPGARLLVITQDARSRRGEIERAFLNHLSAATDTSSELFEFSLGIPLSQLTLARGAHLVLRWLVGSIQENELDWLLSTGQIASTQQEATSLTVYMRGLRRRSLERTHWTLSDFIAQRSSSNPLPDGWVERISVVQQRVNDFSRHSQSPLEWASLAPQLLEAAGWPGFRPLSSAEFQAHRRWQLALESCGSLGFDGRHISWHDFLSLLRRTLDETLFAPESHDAPIQIAGPAESAGLTADAVWFLGADEDAWPAAGALHPLLPVEIQRHATMPHASAEVDWELARTTTRRILSSAPEIHFSFARQNQNADSRPSRLILDLAGAPQPLPADLIVPPAPNPMTILVEDFSRIPFSPAEAPGGASVLTYQSQCPFKAFATSRLSAQGWAPAEPCLTPAQRGNLLHAVVHAIWAGPPLGIRDLDDLLNLTDRSSFAAGHVQRILAAKIPTGLRRRMPQRYLELEELRLTRLIAEWLDYEAARWPFSVAATEIDSTATVAGLKLKLRLDRIDRLKDNTLLVIDYKTGDVTPSSWELPRPDDVQLPLYAGFALDRENDTLGGLVFAKIRVGKHCFAGRVGDAKGALLSNAPATSTLVKKPLDAGHIIAWRECIEKLAADFLAGRAEVDPREYPKTCERCNLQALCRVQENRAHFTTPDDTVAILSAEAAGE